MINVETAVVSIVKEYDLTLSRKKQLRAWFWGVCGELRTWLSS